MLDAFIIDELRRRERERERADDRPRLELPLHYEREGAAEDEELDIPSEDDPVIIINFE